MSISAFYKITAMANNIAIVESNFAVPFDLSGAPTISTFIGRSNDIRAMEKYLLPVEDAKKQKILVLHGLGGIGKTQLALEFAKIHRDRFTAIFWINENTEQHLRMGIARIRDQIPSSATSAEKGVLGDNKMIERAVKIAFEWLRISSNFRWLMIFDNIDSPVQSAGDSTAASDTYTLPAAYDIRAYLRSISHGSIVITTRLGCMTQLRKGLHVDKMSFDEGVKILQSVSTQLETTGERF